MVFDIAKKKKGISKQKMLNSNLIKSIKMFFETLHA